MKLLQQQVVKDESDQVLLRSKIRAVARRMGFANEIAERIVLVSNEMSSNLLKFAARTGMIQLWESNRPNALDLFVMDYGPGISDISLATRDGYTTAGTMGKGLGAIVRLADASGFYSQKINEMSPESWHGFAGWARFLSEHDDAGYHRDDYGCYLRAYQDDRYNGDGIYIQHRASQLRWLHMDGLGHGLGAAEVVLKVRHALNMDMPLDELLSAISEQLRGSRGAVGILGEVVRTQDINQASLCGVGDMHAFHVKPTGRNDMRLAEGILGHEHQRVFVQSFELADDDLVITASDGIRRNWSLSSFPGLWRQHPQLIALFLGQMASRHIDDKSLFVIGPLHINIKGN